MGIKCNDCIVPDTANTIQKKSLADHAADIIRKMIIQGECSPGSKITEYNFSKMFGISRGCVREAFMILQDEGLIIKEKNTCTRVVKFNNKDIEDIYKLRAALEKMCAEICIENDLDVFSFLLPYKERIDISANKDPFDINLCIEEDLKFHDALIKLSGNKLAVKTWETIKQQVKALLFLVIKKDKEIININASSSHEKILNAFKNKDNEKAYKLIKDHIIKNMNVMIDNIK